MDRNSTVDVPLTLREAAALQLLATTGENTDPEAVASIAAKAEAALEAFRKGLGTRRFAALLKSGWRHGVQSGDESVGEAT